MHCHRVSVKYEIEVNVAAVLRDLFSLCSVFRGALFVAW